jgi:hypothetical protein
VEGLGGCDIILTGGYWTTTETILHINAQDLSLCPRLLQSPLAHITYTKSLILVQIVKEVWQCLDREITLKNPTPARSREHLGRLHEEAPHRLLTLDAQPTLVQ